MITQEMFLAAEKIIFSGPHSQTDAKYKKIAGRRIRLNGRDYMQFEMVLDKKIYHENIAVENLSEYFSSKINLYRQADLYFSGGGHYMAFNRRQGGEIAYHRVKKNTAAVNRDVIDGGNHNKEKNYIINEGTDIPILVELGIFTKELKIVNSMYPKFKQINRFIELFDDVISKKYRDYNRESINIIDFGCGKSYLTFVMYHYLVNIKKYDVKITGVDLKADVIEKCSALRDRYKYSGLSFETGDINGYEPHFKPNVVVSLHGCDLATDYALHNALRWGADVIFAAPCCEHEINSQIDTAPLQNVLKYGVVKERFSALLTNSLRCNILEMCDYKTELIEFVDIAHSPKNLLIRAVKSSHKKPYKEAVRKQLEETLKNFQISPTLYKLTDKSGELCP